MSDGTAKLEARGAIRVVHMSKDVIVTKMTGRFDMALAHAIVGTLEPWMRGRRHLVAFHDCESVSDYDVDARDWLSKWSRANAAPFHRVHLLVGSRVLAWAVRLINIVAGGFIVTHHERAAFEAEVAKARAA